MTKATLRKHTRQPAWDDDYEFNCQYCGFGLDANRAGEPRQAQQGYAVVTVDEESGGFEAAGFEALDFETEARSSATLVVDTGGIERGCPFCHSPNWRGARSAGDMKHLGRRR